MMNEELKQTIANCTDIDWCLASFDYMKLYARLSSRSKTEFDERMEIARAWEKRAEELSKQKGAK